MLIFKSLNPKNFHATKQLILSNNKLIVCLHKHAGSKQTIQAKSILWSRHLSSHRSPILQNAMFERGVAAGWPGSPLLNGHQPRRGFLTKLLHERDLRQLEGKANSMLNDGPLQLHFLQQLNRYHPEAVVERYEMGGFSRGEPHLREYCRALAALGRLNTEADIQRVIQDYSGPGGERVATSAIAAARSGLMGNSAASPKPVHVNVADSSWSAQLWRSARVLGVAFIVFSAIGASMDSRGLSSRLGMQNSSSPMPTASDKKFDDVVGVDEAKAELKELVMYLRDPGQFTRLGGKLPKGMLLTGPPGTGKTLLARAIAGEANVPFFYASGSEFEEMYVGVGARRVRDLFGAAKKSSPCIIFIDEIDAIGGSRQNKDHQSMKMTLNQLLVEMDGFKQNNGIIVVGATNYPDVLDTALTRPGRFDRHVNVPLPDVEGRRQILNLYAKKVTLDKAVDLKYLARGTPGMSGADLQNLVNQAALKASVEGAAAVGMPDLEFARDKILMGAERKSAIISPETARTTAYHEGGHALVALKTPGADPIHKATIMPRGPALGYVAFLPEGDQTSISRKQMLAKLDVGMGGRVAEEIIFGKENITSGAASDLKNATNIAKAMVTQYGMSREVGYVAHDLKNDSPESLAIIDREVKKLLCEAYERAKTVITTNRKGLDRLAKALLEYETLTKEEVEEVVRTGKIKGKIAKK